MEAGGADGTDATRRPEITRLWPTGSTPEAINENLRCRVLYVCVGAYARIYRQCSCGARGDVARLLTFTANIQRNTPDRATATEDGQQTNVEDTSVAAIPLEQQVLSFLH
jgi:hypothetical protein